MSYKLYEMFNENIKKQNKSNQNRLQEIEFMPSKNSTKTFEQKLTVVKADS